MPARKLPPNPTLIGWLNDGKTHQQIVDLVKRTTGEDVSLQAVSVAVSRLGMANRRKNHVEYIPWRVQARHTRQYPVLMLRAYARYMDADRDVEALTPDDRRRLFNWLAHLEEEQKVVDYQPDNGGFLYVPRKPGEEVIRQPKGGPGNGPPLRKASGA